MILLAATTVAAQDAIFPIEGSEHTYYVENHSGNGYNWEVVTNTNPYTPANNADYELVGSTDQNMVSIRWKEAGNYLIIVTESDFNGCTNRKALAISVSGVNLTAQFTTTSQSACFGDLSDGLQLPLAFKDQDEAAFAPNQFPITLNYSIDGVAQAAQSITYADQFLSINSSQLSGDGSVDQAYSVEITGATDALKQPIQSLAGQNIYTLNTQAMPMIDFAKSQVYVSDENSDGFSVNGEADFSYSWSLEDPNGTPTALASHSSESGALTFAESGTYYLTVTANATNGCANQATLVIEVSLDEDEETEPEPSSNFLFAVNDYSQGWKDEEIRGNVLTNDLVDLKNCVLKLVSQPSADFGRLTNFKKNGDFSFVPSGGFVGDVVFEYQICQETEDGATECSSAQVVVQVLETNLSAALPVAIDKFYVLSKNASISGNFITQDYELEKAASLVSKVTSTGLSGQFNSSNDGSFSYQPPADFSGFESFSYQLCNDGGCDWGTVTFYVIDPDENTDGLFAADNGHYNAGVLSGSLPSNCRLDGSPTCDYSLVSGPQFGTAEVSIDGQFVYTPNPGQTGYFTDHFTYQIESPEESSKATIYVCSHIDEPTLIVRNLYTTGACMPVQLDASRSSGVAPLQFSWSGAEFLDDANSATPNFMPGESSQYTLTMTDALGNTDSRTVTVEVAPEPEIVTSNMVFVDNTSQSVMLDASESVGSNLSYRWTSGNTGVIVSGQETATPEVLGVGKYYLSITDEYGCMAQDSVVVGIWVQAVDDEATVLENAYVSINVLRNDLPVGELDPTSVSIVVPANNGTAEARDDSTIVYTPYTDFLGEDSFVYQVCNFSNHCDEATVLVMVSEEALFIPNAFTPNGDGYNDHFTIKGLKKYSNVHLKIFNRWGNLVFESDNYGDYNGGKGCWDGVANRGVRVGHDLVAGGTYFYILDLGKGTEKLSGFIYIDR